MSDENIDSVLRLEQERDRAAKQGDRRTAAVLDQRINELLEHHEPHIVTEDDGDHELGGEA